MATNNAKRGVEWNKDEREALHPKVQHAQRVAGRIDEQVRRISMMLGEYLPQAEAARQHLRNGLGAVLALNLTTRGPKRKALSAQEVEAVLGQLPELLKPWQQFVTSSAFAAAARDKNKQVKAHNAEVRAHNRAAEQQHAEACEKMRAFYAKADAGDVSGALAEAAKLGLL